MRLQFRSALFVVSLTGAVSVALAAANSPAARLKNPVQADAKSIAAGKATYDNACAKCHGETGKGDGRMGDELDPNPSNLVDGYWKHGSTDGNIYTAIHDGNKGTGMRAYGRKLTPHQIWDVVNYLRSIGPH